MCMYCDMLKDKADISRKLLKSPPALPDTLNVVSRDIIGYLRTAERLGVPVDPTAAILLCKTCDLTDKEIIETMRLYTNERVERQNADKITAINISHL